MRAVIDANVHVSALIGAGPPARIMTAWQGQLAFDLVVCPQLIAEISNVFDRAHVRRKLPLAAADLHLLTLATQAMQMPDPEPIEAATRDQNDDYLIALARAAFADFIVTGDKDLLEWPEQQPPVVTPAEFEDLLGAETV
ncbi:putative toxin-antitoxin system toxin component, PIN family [Candidatus Poriferisodalis sp.]|uniref:putative toxin-antitoxin system toxin component, PIN family n=1 Tax=Candidatus Poriferisodalis sp. TaxID=3101277 RepID=UPI003B5A852E